MTRKIDTAEDHRSKGVATAMIRHIHDNTSYSSYALEVADTNLGAVKLYEKLGYREFLRIAEPRCKQSGLNFYVYMSYQKKTDD